MRHLTTAGDETAHINLALAELSPGEELVLEDHGETAAVVLTGVLPPLTGARWAGPVDAPRCSRRPATPSTRRRGPDCA